MSQHGTDGAWAAFTLTGLSSSNCGRPRARSFIVHALGLLLVWVESRRAAYLTFVEENFCPQRIWER